MRCQQAFLNLHSTASHPDCPKQKRKEFTSIFILYQLVVIPVKQQPQQTSPAFQTKMDVHRPLFYIIQLYISLSSFRSIAPLQTFSMDLEYLSMVGDYVRNQRREKKMFMSLNWLYSLR